DRAGCREGHQQHSRGQGGTCYEVENEPGSGDAAGNAPAPSASPRDRCARRFPAVQPPVLSHRTPPPSPAGHGSVPVNRGCWRSLRQSTENGQLPDIWKLTAGQDGPRRVLLVV